MALTQEVEKTASNIIHVELTLGKNQHVRFTSVFLYLKIMDSAATENMISPSHVVAITNGDASSSLDSGHARLLELGYKQQLKRDLS